MLPLILPPVGPDGIQSDPHEESLKDCLEDPPQSNTVALKKLPDSFSKDVLVLLLEKISGVPEKEFTLELITESNIAVVIFNDLEGMSLTTSSKTEPTVYH